MKKEQDQYEYQRSVIRDDYITEEDIDKCLEESESAPAVSQMRKRRKAGFRRVEKKMGRRLPEHGIPKGEVTGGSRPSVHKLFR